jgi:hypothetical protein
MLLRDCGGIKKLKKLGQSSVFVLDLAFLDPFLGFFFKIFYVKLFPRYYSISVLQNTQHMKRLSERGNKTFQQNNRDEITNCFLQYKLIVINHVICFCKDKILEVRIGITEEFQ